MGNLNFILNKVELLLMNYGIVAYTFLNYFSVLKLCKGVTNVMKLSMDQIIIFFDQIEIEKKNSIYFKWHVIEFTCTQVDIYMHVNV